MIVFPTALEPSNDCRMDSRFKTRSLKGDAKCQVFREAVATPTRQMVRGSMFFSPSCVLVLRIG